MAAYLTGVVSDQFSFAPILLTASVVPLIAVVAVLLLVRNNDATRRGVVKEIWTGSARVHGFTSSQVHEFSSSRELELDS